MTTPGALTRTSDAAIEPVTLAQAKTHLRVDFDDDNAEIEADIEAAREIIEDAGEMALITQTWRLRLDNWPCVIELPRAPVQSVTSIKYFDTAGVEQTLVAGTDYQVALDSTPPRIAPEPDMSWPAIESGRLSPISIVFVAGFGAAASDVPRQLISAVLLQVAALYEFREDITDAKTYPLTDGVRRIISHHRNMSA